MSIILTPFAKLVLLFYHLTNSYGASIILFCLVIRAVLFPAFLKGRKSMLAMSGLTEKQKFLQQKYARDREQYSIELQKLYDEEGVKPSSGCLWSLLPVLFLMPLYSIVRSPLTHLLGMNEDTFNAVANFLYKDGGSALSYSRDQLKIAQDIFTNYDSIIQNFPNLAGMEHISFTFLGLNLSETPHILVWRLADWASWSNIGLWLIPVISAALGVVSMIVSNKINSNILGTSKVMDQNAKTTMMFMPLFSLWLCFTLPAALGLYWIANSVFAIVQELLNIPFLKKFTEKQKVERAKRQEDEKLRVRKEKQLQAEAKKKAAEEMRRIQMERKLNKSLVAESRIGIRAYARGRMYDPSRYESFPYREPTDILREQIEAQKLKEAESTKRAIPALEKNEPIAAVEESLPAESAQAPAAAETEAE